MERTVCGTLKLVMWKSTDSSLRAGGVSRLRSKRKLRKGENLKRKWKSLKKQVKTIARLSTSRKAKRREPSSKSWCQHTRQQQYNKQKSLVGSIQGVVTFCEEESFKACSVELENINTGKHKVVDMASGAFLFIRTLCKWWQCAFSSLHQGQVFCSVSWVKQGIKPSELQPNQVSYTHTKWQFQPTQYSKWCGWSSTKPTGTHYGSTDSPSRQSVRAGGCSTHNQNKIDRWWDVNS